MLPRADVRTRMRRRPPLSGRTAEEANNSFCSRRGLREGAIEGVLAGGVGCVGLTVMHLIGRHQTDTGMVMLLIVPIEESSTERLGILDAAEALWKLRLVFHGFEVAFRKGIVVGGVRPAVGSGDTEIGK